MQLPLDITWRGVDASPHLASFIEGRVANLDRFARQINRCSVTIERQHEHPQSGSGWRVRLDLTVPPGHEIVVVRESWQGTVRDDLYAVVKEAFTAARRQIQKLSAQQRGEVKRHEEQELDGVISRLAPEGFGFLTTGSGREIYFHRNSVVDMRFEDLKLGMGVAFSEEPGDKGPQATTIRVVDRRGHYPVTAAEEPRPA
jgi:cold shock CspA family protein/ribosome-associated translation inhibitor RaiA